MSPIGTFKIISPLLGNPLLEILGKGNIKISVKNKPKIVNINRLILSSITPSATNQRRKN